MLRGIMLTIGLVALPQIALADELCAVEEGAQWIEEDKVREIAAANGAAEIRKVEEEDGCLEAKGMTADGKKIEVYVHPVSGDVAKIKIEE